MATNRLLPLLVLAAWWLPLVARADETEAERAKRISKMSTEDKEILAGKKKRFDELKPAELAHLQGLYAAVSKDPNSQRHEETIRRYNKWLADLSSGQRGAILQTSDPQERIKKIKELMDQQERDRFQQFVELDLTRADRDVVYSWLEEFVVEHEGQIMTKLREETRQQILNAPDEPSRRSALIRCWQDARRRGTEMPFPAKGDFAQLYEKLSDDTKKRISSAPKSDEQEQRLADLMRTAIWTRVYSQPTRHDLQKFYANMKSDDPRRERLEGLDRDRLYEELRGMYVRERFPGFRGGGRGWPGTRGGGPPPGEFGGHPPKGDGPPPPPSKQP